MGQNSTITFLTVCLLALGGVSHYGCFESQTPSVDTPPPQKSIVGATNPAAKPNVVLISIDTLRPDRMGVYGYEHPTTPFLSSFAADAVLFERFYHNGGGTLPSHMTMMTSLRPATHNVNVDGGTLEDERVTFAERLRDAGYETAGFADGGWLRGRFGFAQGFQLYDDAGGHFEAIMPKADNWVRQHAAGPFFLFLHTYDVHSEPSGLPYHCPNADHERYATRPQNYNECQGDTCSTKLLRKFNDSIYRGETSLSDHLSDSEVTFLSDSYDGCINYIDNQLKLFFSTLRTLGIYDESLIIITSDHGEQFGEHGTLLHRSGGFEEIARIPLLIKLPGNEHGGRRVSHLGAMIDILPTAFDILDLAIEDDRQGTSLLPTIASDTPIRQQVEINSSLRTNRWKYIRKRSIPLRDASGKTPRGDSTAPPLLFDLTTDAHEKTDLSNVRPDMLAKLSRSARQKQEQDKEAYRSFSSNARQLKEIELSETEKSNLRALGYLD